MFVKSRQPSFILTFFALLTVYSANLVHAFYLPGVAPTDYEENDPVPLLVNRLTPMLGPDDQQLKNVVPYDCMLYFGLTGTLWFYFSY